MIDAGLVKKIAPLYFIKAYLYGLTEQGHRLITEAQGIAPEWEWSPKLFEVSDTKFYHEVDLTWFRVLLLCAVELCQKERSLALWRQAGNTWGSLLDVEDLGLGRKVVDPDAVFSLEHRWTGKKLSYILEVDRSTVKVAAMAERYRLYRALLESEIPTRVRGSREAGEPLPFTKFRVITITRSRERTENLRQVAAEIEGKIPMFLFAELDALFDEQGELKVWHPERLTDVLFVAQARGNRYAIF